MRYNFRWHAWNIEHIARHGILPEEAEHVVDHARWPYPQAQEDEKFLVMGQTESGRFIQVVYIFDPPGVVFVIHARPLRDLEKRRLRRRRR